MNEELDSQLSAMFDDELPGAECELLARRLSRDEQLKARWGRYAVMGAVIRAERGVRLNAPLAGRVSAVLLAEPALAGRSAAAAAGRRNLRWWQPLAASGLAAGVAAVSVLWLRAQTPLQGQAPLSAQLTPAPRALPVADVQPGGGSGPALSYITPRAATQAPLAVPSAELANYVVAHSMFSSPVARPNLLSAFMTGEGGAPGSDEPPQDAQLVAK
jgi:sigma-E factor negative regulatory protein RseA